MIRVAYIFLFSVVISCQQKLCPTYSSIENSIFESDFVQTLETKSESKIEVSL